MRSTMGDQVWFMKYASMKPGVLAYNIPSSSQRTRLSIFRWVSGPMMHVRQGRMWGLWRRGRIPEYFDQRVPDRNVGGEGGYTTTITQHHAQWTSPLLHGTGIGGEFREKFKDIVTQRRLGLFARDEQRGDGGMTRANTANHAGRVSCLVNISDMNRIGTDNTRTQQDSPASERARETNSSSMTGSTPR